MGSKQEHEEQMPEEKSLTTQLGENLGVATKEVWKIFVRQYLVRGLSELLVAATGFILAYYLHTAGGLPYQVGSAVLSLASILYIKSAIPLIFNPGYYAAGNIATSLKMLAKGKDERYY